MAALAHRTLSVSHSGDLGYDRVLFRHRLLLATQSCEAQQISHRERKPDQDRGIENREELRMRGEFMAFLKQYGVMGLAIAVLIGGKANALVTAVVVC